jgi:hypothetical protein
MAFYAWPSYFNLDFACLLEGSNSGQRMFQVARRPRAAPGGYLGDELERPRAREIRSINPDL